MGDVAAAVISELKMKGSISAPQVFHFLPPGPHQVKILMEQNLYFLFRPRPSYFIDILEKRHNYFLRELPPLCAHLLPPALGQASAQESQQGVLPIPWLPRSKVDQCTQRSGDQAWNSWKPCQGGSCSGSLRLPPLHAGQFLLCVQAYSWFSG